MNDWFQANDEASFRMVGLSQRAAEKHVYMMRTRRTGRGLFARIPSIPSVGVSIPDLGTRPARAVKTYWWVPAGIAVLILVRSIIGG